MANGTEPTIRIDFDLGPDDIAYFRNRLEHARKNWSLRDDDRVILGAEAMAVKALESSPPDFIKHRIALLQTMVGMVKDRDWQLREDDRNRVLNVLAYFADPKDIVADDIPVLGLLDDAIMIDLAAFELEPEIEAYTDFLANLEDLKAGIEDAQPVDAARDSLQRRMRRRRRRRGGGTAHETHLTIFQSPDG